MIPFLLKKGVDIFKPYVGHFPTLKKNVGQIPTLKI